MAQPTPIDPGLAFDQQQNDLRAMVRALLDRQSTEADVRRTMETDDGFDPSLWTQLGTELGLGAIAVPEQYGGAGYGWPELAVVLEELGRSLACLPYFSSVVLAQGLLLAADDEPAALRWLPQLASGALRGTVAVLEQPGPWTDTTIHTTARQAGGAWRLSGSKTFVLDGATAELVLVAALGPAGLDFFAIDEMGAVQRTRMRTMDRTRKQARLELRDVPATLIGEPGSGARLLTAMVDRAALAIALDSVGGAERMLEMTVRYARERQQFGRSIGSFQAIKHRCAQMLLEVETAKSAAYGALWAAAGGQLEAPAYASLAKSRCCESYRYVAGEAIQVHGGLGFTWEHPAHLYFRRATTNHVLCGDPTHHRERMLNLLGIG
jgi:alkylation response protein AidB-like acyl-CoA dehydrogenase